MNSIASWSPSQSEPFTVSYMCHSHESSPMLPSAAPIPPCAATVCERVGNTLESTATLKPASDNCSAARRPAPPAPTTTASKLRLATATLDSPEDLHRPAGAADEPQYGRDLERQAHSSVVDVVHPEIAHSDPGVDQHARDEEEGREAHPSLGEQRLPPRVAHRPGPNDEEEEKRNAADAVENRNQARDGEIERTEVVPEGTLFFRRQIRHVKQSFRSSWAYLES